MIAIEMRLYVFFCLRAHSRYISTCTHSLMRLTVKVCVCISVTVFCRRRLAKNKFAFIDLRLSTKEADFERFLKGTQPIASN